MTPVRFGILSQYYPPELGAPQARLSELAGHFVRRGHDVHVLTAMPSYPKGKVFDGYGGAFLREDVGGARVLRAAVYPSQSTRMAPRMASYLSFVASSALLGAAMLPRLDYLLVESPPLFLGMSGIALAKRTRARMIFNVSDLWPESAVVLGAVREGSAPWRMAAALEALCYKSAWLVTGQSRQIVDDVQRRFPRARTYHLSNGCDTDKYGGDKGSAAVRARLLPDGDAQARVFIYAGLHGIAQGLSQILDCAEQLGRDRRARFVLVGDGPEKQALVASAKARGLDNVRFLDPVPSSEVPALLASADGIIVTLKMEIKGAVPSKIYEAMASERPVILVAAGEAADIVRGAGNFVVSPGDVGALVDSVRSVVDDPGRAHAAARAGRQAAVERFDRRAIADRFIAMLEGS